MNTHEKHDASRTAAAALAGIEDTQRTILRLCFVCTACLVLMAAGMCYAWYSVVSARNAMEAALSKSVAGTQRSAIAFPIAEIKKR